ncbi:unnamed protein product [Vitrella brassicaformis CCMP3155]|uniref:Major facilitator superfamily (MFS) profile domain-containing protein n=1 Tax=Vitrella brassicaformis (strain CCMP3155) TaxID=1169540 RepID=A0A0G4EPE4_VITBC|nr:unnamed protein product [Vitrella brassicaformis CCMP3155]|eukprot:CEL99692.1 unnamed protein product [Vitrella brassicaformis CCMP3155]
MDAATLRSLILVYVTVFIDMMAATLVIPILPYLIIEYEADDSWIGILTAAYSASQLISNIALARITDFFRSTKLGLIISLVGSVGGNFASGFSRNEYDLLLWRALTGLFAGSAPVAQGYIVSVTTAEQRPRYLAITGSMISAALLFGPAIAGGLTVYSYYMPFFVAAGVAAGNTLLTLGFFREQRDAAHKPRARAQSLTPPPDSSLQREIVREEEEEDLPMMVVDHGEIVCRQTSKRSECPPDTQHSHYEETKPLKRERENESDSKSDSKDAADGEGEGEGVDGRQVTMEVMESPSDMYHREAKLVRMEMGETEDKEPTEKEEEEEDEKAAKRKKAISLTLIGAASFLHGGAFSVVQTTLGLYLSEEFGVDPLDLGFILSGVAVIFIISQLIIFDLTRKWVGLERTAIIGESIMLVALVVAPLADTLWLFLLILGVNVMGNSMVTPSIPSILAYFATSGNTATVISIGQSSQAASRVVFPIILGFVYEYNKAWSWYFSGAIGAVALIVWVAFFLSRTLEEKKKKLLASREEEMKSLLRINTAKAEVTTADKHALGEWFADFLYSRNYTMWKQHLNGLQWLVGVAFPKLREGEAEKKEDIQALVRRYKVMKDEWEQYAALAQSMRPY